MSGVPHEGRMTTGEEQAARSHGGARWWYLLLVLPFIGLLIVPIYAHETPKLFGFPFFYWYQFAWVIVAALLTIFVYKATRPPTRPPR
jgi:uncharacterized membrane protein YhdT